MIPDGNPEVHPGPDELARDLDVGATRLGVAGVGALDSASAAEGAILWQSLPSLTAPPRPAMPHTMNVSLTPELERFARGLVEEGDYGSASEVMREALRLLKQKRARDQQIEELRGLIREGLESGPPVVVTRDEMKGMMRTRAVELRAQVERGERPAPGGPDSIPA